MSPDNPEASDFLEEFDDPDQFDLSGDDEHHAGAFDESMNGGAVRLLHIALEAPVAAS